MSEVALLQVVPRLAARVPWVTLGVWPTPVEPLRLRPDLWVKRDDLSGLRYGGNKVRTLEALFGRAQAARARRVWATGAVGSNHALATVLYARDAGLEPAVMLFPQPETACARENLEAMLGERPTVRPLRHWATLPAHILVEQRRPGSYVMVPGGATPDGALGYVSAALELALQIEAGELPAPRHVVVGVGSTCTAAGLVAGFAIAARLGLLSSVPSVCAVRVTPWPVTSAWRVVGLAVRTAALISSVAGDARFALTRRDLAGRLRVVGGFLGRGYGYVTPSGLAAIEAFRAAGGPPLDTCYSGKVAAALLALPLDGPVLFWSTKSSRPLPPPSPSPSVPRPMARWLARAARL